MERNRRAWGAIVAVLPRLALAALDVAVTHESTQPYAAKLPMKLGA